MKTFDLPHDLEGVSLILPYAAVAFFVASLILPIPESEYKGVAPKTSSELRWMIKRLSATTAILFGLFTHALPLFVPLIASPAVFVFFLTPLPPQRVTGRRILGAVLALILYVIILGLLSPLVN